LDTPTQAFRV